MADMQKHIYSVYELTQEIKQLIERAFPDVWVEGEISNFTRHFSGHYYFTVKDDKAQISCVMWKRKTFGLSFLPENGMKVLLRGSLTVYEKSGRYQLDTSLIYPKGVGDLQLAFDQLKKKLESEGLFDPARKKPVPFLPAGIGVLTSPTGAVIRDIRDVAFRRFPGIKIILRPVKVQGEGSEDDIAAGMKDLNEFNGIDVIICGRGGGSLEDLWAFNEEKVARAIAASNIPVISAVGHETDFTIADFVADLRAPTPSAAAELAVPDKADIDNTVNTLLQRLVLRTTEKVNFLKEKLHGLENSYAFRKPVDMLKQYTQQVDELAAGIERNFSLYLKGKKDLIIGNEKRLNSLDPEKVLNRGYCITYKMPGKTIVKESNQLSENGKILIKLAKGYAGGSVSVISKSEPEM